MYSRICPFFDLLVLVFSFSSSAKNGFFKISCLSRVATPLPHQTKHVLDVGVRTPVFLLFSLVERKTNFCLLNQSNWLLSFIIRPDFIFSFLSENVRDQRNYFRDSIKSLSVKRIWTKELNIPFRNSILFNFHGKNNGSKVEKRVEYRGQK